VNSNINFGVLFILAFALFVGTRPVRVNDPGSDESIAQLELVDGSSGHCRGGVCDVALRRQLAGIPSAT
jgi:hypothetical protein